MRTLYGVKRTIKVICRDIKFVSAESMVSVSLLVAAATMVESSVGSGVAVPLRNDPSVDNAPGVGVRVVSCGIAVLLSAAFVCAINACVVGSTVGIAVGNCATVG